MKSSSSLTRCKRKSNASRRHCSCWFIVSYIIDCIIDDLLVAWMTHQIAGSGDAPTTPLSCITQSCIRITSITALLCAMYEYVLVR